MIITEEFKNKFLTYLNNLTKEEILEIMENSKNEKVFDFKLDPNVFSKKHIDYIESMVKKYQK